MRYPFYLCVATALILANVTPGFAWSRPVLPGDVTVEIVSDSGRQFPTIQHQDLMTGTTRIVKRYLEANKGGRYSILIRNNSPERLGLVIAVDGRNIITGKRSELKNQEGMYVVNPYQSGRYEGWRTTSEEVHRFYFTEPANSYSVRTFGDSSAMGVIAVAVYREKKKPQPWVEEKKQEAVPQAPAASAAPRNSAKGLSADQSAGTGFGEAYYSPVVAVEFEPERLPIQKTLVKYEWRETLCRKGLLPCGQETGNRLWDDYEYAPYPPRYR